MTRRVGLAIAGICLSVAGLACSERAAAASGGITCAAGADCEAKWARARQWVMDNSKYPITVDSDTEVSTVTRTTFHDPGLIVTVNKFRRGDGAFTITLRAGCGLLFGACTPPIERAQRSFARYVTLSSNTATPAQTAPAGSVAPSATDGKPPAAAAEVAVPPVSPVGENPDNMLLLCRGGGPMTLHFADPPGDGGRDGVLLELSFQHAAHGARQAPLAPGECAFANRPLRADEPALLSVSGPSAGLGVDMRLSSDGHITSYAIKGVGGVHDVIGTVANGVLNRTDFSLHVANVGTLRLRALVH